MQAMIYVFVHILSLVQSLISFDFQKCSSAMKTTFAFHFNISLFSHCPHCLLNICMIPHLQVRFHFRVCQHDSGHRTLKTPWSWWRCMRQVNWWRMENMSIRLWWEQHTANGSLCDDDDILCVLIDILSPFIHKCFLQIKPLWMTNLLHTISIPFVTIS